MLISYFISEKTSKSLLTYPHSFSNSQLLKCTQLIAIPLVFIQIYMRKHIDFTPLNFQTETNARKSSRKNPAYQQVI